MSLIYIVEDDNDIIEIEKFALINSGYEVKGFSNAVDFYAQMIKLKPQLIILDIMLPDEDGLQILKKVRQMDKTAAIPIIMVTAKTTELDKVRGLDMGADDYLAKPFGVMELIARVKALLRRSEALNPDKKILKLEEINIDDEKRLVTVYQEHIDLTYKEYELLKVFIENKGIVLTRESLMNKIWGVDYMGETRTVDMHIKTLRRKLKESGNRIKTIRNVGYMMGEK